MDEPNISRPVVTTARVPSRGASSPPATDADRDADGHRQDPGAGGQGVVPADHLEVLGDQEDEAGSAKKATVPRRWRR